MTDIPIQNQKEALALSRWTLKNYFNPKTFERPMVDEEFFKKPRGVFVTLLKDHVLRGCIGIVHPIYSLEHVIQEMTLGAALRDPRFESVAEKELNTITIEISLLGTLEKIKSSSEIVIGEHGLMVEDGPCRGVLLPQVATEQKWTAVQFLEHTCNKAGLPLEGWKSESCSIYRFSAIVISEGK